jgi:predicted protein tyrosine phosphatase
MILEPDVLGGPNVWMLVLSRPAAARVKPNVPHLVISVTDPEMPEAHLADSPLRMGVLRLKFHDVGEDRPRSRAPGEEDARAIVEFVKARRSMADLIVCHCEAGISRSSGIAAALSRWLNGHDEEFFRRYLPNRLIYRLIRRELGDLGVMV